MLEIHTRHLPHWTQEGAVYFITFNVASANLTVREMLIVRDHIAAGHNKFYRLFAVQVMSSHIHLIIQPKPAYSLSRIMNGMKGVTSRLVNKSRSARGHLWREESYDRIIRDEKELLEKMKYMYENPIKAGIVDEGDDWLGWFAPDNE